MFYLYKFQYLNAYISKKNMIDDVINFIIDFEFNNLY